MLTLTTPTTSLDNHLMIYTTTAITMTTTGGNGPSRRFPPRLLPRLTPRPSNKGGKLARTSPGCHPYGPTVPGSLTRHSGSRRPVGPAGCCGVWGCLRPLFTQATQAFSSWKIRGILGPTLFCFTVPIPWSRPWVRNRAVE